MEVPLVTSIVLVGGRGLRLGREKAVEKIDNQTLLERVINCLALLGNEILVVTAQGQPNPLPPPQSEKIRILVDIYPNKGALGGIYTGLRASDSFYNLVVACDLPFLNINLLRYLIDCAPNFDAVVPRFKGEIEPLHSVYSKNCLTAIDKQLEQGRLKVRDFLNQVKVRYVEEEEIDRFDPEHWSFFNINSEADLQRARELAQREAIIQP